MDRYGNSTLALVIPVENSLLQAKQFRFSGSLYKKWLGAVNHRSVHGGAKII